MYDSIMNKRIYSLSLNLHGIRASCSGVWTLLLAMTETSPSLSTTSPDSSVGAQTVQPGPSTSSVNSLSQNLNLHLTVHKLNGKNYLKWAQFVKLAMEGKGKPG